MGIGEGAIEGGDDRRKEREAVRERSGERQRQRQREELRQRQRGGLSWREKRLKVV